MRIAIHEKWGWMKNGWKNSEHKGLAILIKL